VELYDLVKDPDELTNAFDELNFHNLRHQWFRVNYGNSMFPIDKLFNSWHDGSEQGMKTLRSRVRKTDWRVTISKLFMLTLHVWSEVSEI